MQSWPRWRPSSALPGQEEDPHDDEANTRRTVDPHLGYDARDGCTNRHRNGTGKDQRRRRTQEDGNA